jgi:hypothetical protein
MKLHKTLPAAVVTGLLVLVGASAAPAPGTGPTVAAQGTSLASGDDDSGWQ